MVISKHHIFVYKGHTGIFLIIFKNSYIFIMCILNQSYHISGDAEIGSKKYQVVEGETHVNNIQSY